MSGLKDIMKKVFIFNEPEANEKFILRETEEERKEINQGKNIDKKSIENGECKKKKNYDLLLNKEQCCKEKSSEKQEKRDKKGPEKKKEHDISSSLEYNLEYIKHAYYIPDNGDIVLREFEVIIHGKPVSAFIVFFDGLVDRKVIDDNILQPLMLLANLCKNKEDKSAYEIIKNQLLNHNQIKESGNFQEVIDEVNFGGCGLFVDGVNMAFAADVKGWEHRGVSRPNTELVIKGPQEGFTEILRVNTALIRKILKDEKLIAENVSLGERSKTACSLMYIKDIANEELVDEVRRRLESIKVDYLTDAGELEQLIEDSTFFPTPQIMSTERPDKVAFMLSEGKVAVALNGNPFVLVMPTTATDLVKSAEDNYIRYPFAFLIKFVRYLGLFVSLLLPGLYVAVTNFHQEMIPTDLLLAIASSREKVPFPAVVEILIMEISFELIREAGIRIPGPIGPTLGIIGALILGQAAVSANIVSPILIIIVAVTGIGSFAIPNFSMAFSTRTLRFVYILLGAIAGFLGITLGVFIQGLYMVNAKSFGVPLMIPLAPKTSDGIFVQIFRSPIWKEENRPDYMNTKKVKKQEKISREWIKNKPDEDNENED